MSKQLLPVYDKPMIYYPLSVLMLAEVDQILIISTSQDIDRFKKLLGNGSRFGIELEYAIQEHPNGIAEAFLVGESFLNGSHACLILGDNIFYGNGLTDLLKNAQSGVGATILACHVADPQRYGIVEFDHNNKVISLEENPEFPRSDYAITG